MNGWNGGTIQFPVLPYIHIVLIFDAKLFKVCDWNALRFDEIIWIYLSFLGRNPGAQLILLQLKMDNVNPQRRKEEKGLDDHSLVSATSITTAT